MSSETPLCSERGLPVTAFVKTVKQPRGGFLNPNRFRHVDHDENSYVDSNRENISPIIMGIVVDYLTRLHLGRCNPEEAFEISLRGAYNVNHVDNAWALINTIEKAEGQLTRQAIVAACQLSGYDVAYRAGSAFFKGVDQIRPDKQTVMHVEKLVNRAVNFFDSVGIIDSGMTFEGGYTRRVIKGDADYLSLDALWDMKVSVKGPTKDHTLQMLIYRVLASRSDNYKHQDIKRIGFFNPRYNRAYLFDMADLDSTTWTEVYNLVCD